MLINTSSGQLLLFLDEGLIPKMSAESKVSVKSPDNQQFLAIWLFRPVEHIA
jgi:hypothetical protein